MKYVTTVGEQSSSIEINRDGESVIDGERFVADLHAIDGLGTYSLLLNHESYEALVEVREGQIGVLLRGRFYPIDVKDERAERLGGGSRGFGGPTGAGGDKAR